jgi:hypothetical protein
MAKKTFVNELGDSPVTIKIVRNMIKASNKLCISSKKVVAIK